MLEGEKARQDFEIWGCEKVRAPTTTTCRYNYLQLQLHSEAATLAK